MSEQHTPDGRVAVVTGATGLLGSNLVRELVRRGWTVLAVARTPSKAEQYLGDLPVTVVQGDMMDVPGFASALDSVDVVFHTAAYFREYYQPDSEWELMKAINVDGTMELLRQANARGVGRVIHTSSSGVIQTGDTPADETAPYSSFAEKNLYFKTKVAAEQQIADYLKGSRIDVVSVLPGWMMGPGDAAPTSAGQLVLDLYHGKLPATIDGGSALADARDVAAGMIAAVDHGERGERFILAGPLARMADIARAVEASGGHPAPKRTLAPWLALTIARVSDGVAKVTGGPSAMPYRGVRTLLENMELSSEKARSRLGATFRPLQETVADTVEWYRTNGFLETN